MSVGVRLPKMSSFPPLVSKLSPDMLRRPKTINRYIILIAKNNKTYNKSIPFHSALYHKRKLDQPLLKFKIFDP